MRRLLAALELGVVFVWQVLVAGSTTAWLILRPGARPSPALVPMPYEQLSTTGAVALACLISLTPGTTAIDVDPARQRLLLHLLDGSDPAGVVAEIRRRFERRLRVLFPEDRP
jgi:multisubunit Na+/H+ antiporter MnhE subunit